MLIELERVVETRSPLGALWAAVADTERTNRAVGLEPVRYREEASGGGARLVGATLLGTVINRVPRRGFSEALYGYGGGGYISKQERYYTEAPLPGTIEVIPAAPMRLGRPEDATPMSVVPDPSPTLSGSSADMGPNGAHESSSHQSVADQPTGHVSTHRPRQAARARRGVVTDDTLHG